MKTALFFNFTDKPFTGYWDGKPKTFKPGTKVYMPQYLAEHYAKHLTNKVLLEQGKETSTSPKFPKQVPEFMNVFKKACILDEESEEKTEAEVAIDVANRGKESSPKTPSTEPQIVDVPGGDDDDEFEGLEDEDAENPPLTPAQKAAATRAANKAAKAAK